jgi:hypothetical protein
MSAYLMLSVIESEDGTLTYSDRLCDIVVKPCPGDTDQDMTDAMIMAIRKETGLPVYGIMRKKAS